MSDYTIWQHIMDNTDKIESVKGIVTEALNEAFQAGRQAGYEQCKVDQGGRFDTWLRRYEQGWDDTPKAPEVPVEF